MPINGMLHTLGGCWRLEGELPSESSPIKDQVAI